MLRSQDTKRVTLLKVALDKTGHVDSAREVPAPGGAPIGALRDRRCGPNGTRGKTGRARALDFGRSTRKLPSEVSEGRKKAEERKGEKKEKITSPEVDNDPGVSRKGQWCPTDDPGPALTLPCTIINALNPSPVQDNI